jgi:DNA-binding phage protein
MSGSSTSTDSKAKTSSSGSSSTDWQSLLSSITGATTKTSSTSTGGTSSDMGEYLKKILASAYSDSTSGASQETKDAYNTKASNQDSYYNKYKGTYESLIDYLSKGGEYGEGKDELESAYKNTMDYYNKVLGGYYLDNKNPYLQSMISQSTDAAKNEVGDAFALGGRSFSGAYAGTLASKIADVQNKYLYENYNTERDRQGDAAAKSYATSSQFSSDLDAIAGNKANAKQAALDVVEKLSNLANASSETKIEAEKYYQSLSDSQKKTLYELVTKVAGIYGTSKTDSTTESDSETKTESEGESDTETEGTSKSKGSQTAETDSDPWQTIVSALTSLGSSYAKYASGGTTA